MQDMLKTRIRWPWVIVVSAIMVTVLLVIFRYHYVIVGSDVYRIDALTDRFCKYPCQTFPPQVYPSQGPTRTPFNIDAYMANQPMKEQLEYARSNRIQKLQAWKPMNMSNFGQQTEASHFQLDALFRQVLEASDGTLWVIYETCVFIGPGGCDRYHFGILDGQRLVEIWLPHDQGEWNAMGLAASSTPDAPVVRVGLWGDTPLPNRQYRVTKHDIVQGPMSAEGYFSNAAMDYDKHLRSGEACRLERSSASPAFVNAVDSRGRARSLLSKSDFLAATQNIVQLSDPEYAYCTHFLDVDLLIAGYRGDQVTFVVAPGRLWLASPAAPFAITRSHLLLLADVSGEEGAHSGGTWDYVNVTRKGP